jgi:tail lysozyme
MGRAMNPVAPAAAAETGGLRAAAGAPQRAATPMAGATFAQKAPGIMSNLTQDFGLTREQAAGLVGNFGAETGGFAKLQEVKPLVPGSRGGWGWAQWTGPRRRLRSSPVPRSRS